MFQIKTIMLLISFEIALWLWINEYIFEFGRVECLVSFTVAVTQWLDYELSNYYARYFLSVGIIFRSYDVE